VNEMTDWTPSEIQSRKNLIVLDPVDTNNDASNTNTQLPTNTFVGGSNSPPDPSLDWRDRGYITSVKNQAQCGDCFAFATVATAESFVIINGRFSN
jgi:C1A family cysteine protease